MASDSVRDHNRFDLQIKVVDVDEQAGTVQYYVQPDPGRYEWRERGNERVLYDRFDNVYFPHALVMDMLKRAMQMTPGPALGVIPDVAAYVGSRRPAIAAALRGESTGGALDDVSEAQLRAFEQDELAFVILSADIKGSTKLQTNTDLQTFAATINALLTEIGELVARFHGHVLKYTGDGLIAYFAPPTFVIKNDAALDCAFCVRRLVYDAINPELEAARLPPIDVRLGLDSGEAAIVVLGSDKTKRHADLIGEVVSLACKIESRAGTGRSLSARLCTGTCTSPGVSCALQSTCRRTGHTRSPVASPTRCSVSTRRGHDPSSGFRTGARSVPSRALRQACRDRQAPASDLRQQLQRELGRSRRGRRARSPARLLTP